MSNLCINKVVNRNFFPIRIYFHLFSSIHVDKQDHLGEVNLTSMASKAMRAGTLCWKQTDLICCAKLEKNSYNIRFIHQIAYSYIGDFQVKLWLSRISFAACPTDESQRCLSNRIAQGNCRALNKQAVALTRLVCLTWPVGTFDAEWQGNWWINWLPLSSRAHFWQFHTALKFVVLPRSECQIVARDWILCRPIKQNHNDDIFAY